MLWGPQLFIVRRIIIFVWQLRKQKLRDREAGRLLTTEVWGRGAAEMSVKVSQHPVSLPPLSSLAYCTVSEFCSCGPCLAYIGMCHIGMWHVCDIGSLFCWICNRTPPNGGGLGSAILWLYFYPTGSLRQLSKRLFQISLSYANPLRPPPREHLEVESVESCYLWPCPGIYQDTGIGVFISRSCGWALWAFISDAPAQEIQQQQGSASSDGQWKVISRGLFETKKQRRPNRHSFSGSFLPWFILNITSESQSRLFNFVTATAD